MNISCAEVNGTIYEVDGSGLPCYTQNAALLGTATADCLTAYTDASTRLLP